MVAWRAGGLGSCNPLYQSRGTLESSRVLSLAPEALFCLAMEDAAESRSWTIQADLDGSRLDAALVALVKGWSRSRLQALVKSGAVRVDGALASKPGQHVQKGARLDVALPAPLAAPSARVARQDLKVLHEDEDVVVLIKPAGLLTHRTERGGENSLAEHARVLFGEMPSLQGEDRPGIVHRLDRETSGVIVLGRTTEALAELMRQFKQREVKKTYRALVHGDPRFDSDWIEAPLGRDPRHPAQVAVVDLADGGRSASTYYEVIERHGSVCLLSASPATGRTHQIRVHLLSIGHPVLGDRTYRQNRGQTMALPGGLASPRRQMLHAHALEFSHPRSGERLSFEAPAPKDFAELCSALSAISDA